MMLHADVAPTAEALDAYRPALVRYCYRMLGSAADADDAVQETMVRAWRGRDRFEHRAPLEAWLYRIATNVCLNLLRSRRRRALPIDVAEGSTASASLGTPRPPDTWVEPLVDGDPAEAAATHESVRLAFVAALQLLPPRQRAALILRDVLRWRADEVAALLDTTVVAVKSALQRARATLAAHPSAPSAPIDSALLGRYVEAFSRHDVEALVALLRDDAVLSMPPFELWLRGPAEIGAWMVRTASDCRGSRFEPVAVNGTLGARQFRSLTPGESARPFALHVVERAPSVNGSLGSIAAIHIFVERDGAAALALRGGVG